MNQTVKETPDNGWRRANVLTVALALVISIWSIAGLIAFFSTPTDGWLLEQPDPFDQIDYMYHDNLMGAPSGLQPGDHVVAIDGQTTTDDLARVGDTWKAGMQMRYTVERSDPAQGVTRVDVTVPLLNWQVGPAFIYVVRQNGVGILLGQFLFAAIALFVFLRRPRESAARVMYYYAVLFLPAGVLTSVFNSNPATSMSPVAGPMSIITILLSFSLLVPPTLLHFALVFPRPKPIVLQRRILIPGLYLIGVLVLVGTVLTLNFLLPYSWTLVSYLGAIFILVHSAFTMRDTISKAQLMWGLFGLIASLLMQSLTYLVTFRLVAGLPAAVINFIVGMSYVVLGGALGMAVLRYRLFDIDIVIRRTLIYGALTLLLGALYIGLITALQQGLVALTGRGDSQLVTVSSTLAVAGAFLPLRNRVQAFVDRRFYRRKYDAALVAARFAGEMRDTVTIDEIAGKLFDAVEDTMQPHKMVLWLPNATSSFHEKSR